MRAVCSRIPNMKLTIVPTCLNEKFNLRQIISSHKKIRLWKILRRWTRECEPEKTVVVFQQLYATVQAGKSCACHCFKISRLQNQDRESIAFSYISELIGEESHFSYKNKPIQPNKVCIIVETYRLVLFYFKLKYVPRIRLINLR